MIVANEISINDYTIGSVGSYTTSSILTGSLIRMYTDASGSNYLSPMEYNYARPYEQNGRVSDFKNITVAKYDDNIDYILSTDGTFVAGSTGVRQISAMAFDKSKNEWIEAGSLAISCSFDFGATNKIRSLGAAAGYFYRYSSGSVQVNGLDVTGSSTNWETNRIFQGSRIGFGTTSSADVTQWYEIATVPTQTNFKLVNSSLEEVTYPSGTPYVIEEMKIITPVRHATSSFDGLLVINGITRNSFTAANSLLYQYTSSADDRKQGYYLIRESHPSGSLKGAPFATAFEPNRISPTEHYAYFCDASFPNPVTVSSAFRYYKCNINAPVSQSTFFNGAVSESFTAATDRIFFGAAAATPGLSIPIASIGHSERSGSMSMYHYARSTAGLFRIFQIPLDGTAIYSGSTSYLKESTVETPPGTQETTTFIGINSLAYVSSIDKFVIAPGNVAGSARFALVTFNSGVNENARYGTYALGTRNRFTSMIGDSQQPKHAISSADVLAQVAASDDILYVSIGAPTLAFATSAGSLYAVPVACDWEAAPKTKQWITFPPIHTPNATTYSSIYTKSPSFLGSDTLGFVPDKMVVYYRTTGISDDTGEWKRVMNNIDLKSIPVAEQIQFSIAFDIFGTIGLYNRLQGICFTYNDNQQDDHYQASLEQSNIANNQIVWTQIKNWNSVIPNLKINIFNNLNNSIIIDDTTAAQTQGTFEYSVNNGATFLPWDSTQDAIGNRIRYTAIALPANTNVKIILNKK
jgi:hypothetical protein